jgi:hypothetical protein
LEECFNPQVEELIAQLQTYADEWKNVPMLAKTHGQPASPTRLGKEIMVYVYRLTEQLNSLKACKITAKFGGATGNYNAHHVAYPQYDWKAFGNKFVCEKLGLEREQYTTQISNYDYLGAIFDAIRRINTIIIDETVNKKVLKAFEHGITPIICCGETLTQREQGITIDWIRQQIKIAFLNVTAAQAATAVIAYEPIWAIGTGKVATTEQAQEVCKAIRECIAEIYDDATAAAIRIQYGGSVSASSAPELFAQADIDGGLVGGASLKADFGQIVNYK